MSAETFPPVPMSWWKKLFSSPLLWALICTGAAVPNFLSGKGMDLLPILLILVGGALFGVAFLKLAFGIRRIWLGVLVHVLLAVILGATLYWLASEGRYFVETLPEQTAALVMLFQMVAIPAAALIYLALLSRITLVAKKPAKATKVARLAPTWEEAGAELACSSWPYQ